MCQSNLSNPFTNIDGSGRCYGIYFLGTGCYAGISEMVEIYYRQITADLCKMQS